MAGVAAGSLKVIYGEAPARVRRVSGESPMILRGCHDRFGIPSHGFSGVPKYGALISPTTRNALIQGALFVASSGLLRRVVGSGNGDSDKGARFAADVDRIPGFEQESLLYHLNSRYSPAWMLFTAVSTSASCWLISGQLVVGRTRIASRRPARFCS
jgi:hypothetical protein